jgi:hypothetical protein
VNYESIQKTVGRIGEIALLFLLCAAFCLYSFGFCFTDHHHSCMASQCAKSSTAPENVSHSMPEMEALLSSPDVASHSLHFHLHTVVFVTDGSQEKLLFGGLDQNNLPPFMEAPLSIDKRESFTPIFPGQRAIGSSCFPDLRNLPLLI